MAGNTTTDERLGCVSASTMERHFACAGCRALEKAVEAQSVKPVEKDSAAASKGSLLHESNESGDVCDLEMSDQEAVKRIRESEEQITRQWCADIGAKFEDITADNIFREQRFWFMDVCSAKVDLLIVLGDQGLIIDTKTGKKSVAAPSKNWQLRSCVVAARSKHGFQKCRTAIANLWGRKDPPCDYTFEDILQISRMLTKRLIDIEKPDQPRTPGPHCTFCPAHAICPELRENITPILRQRSLNWSLVKPEQKRPLFEMATLGKKACEAILAQLKADLANDPESAPGLMKRKDGETRKITDPVGAFRVLKDEFEAAEESFISASSISLSAFKELLNEQAGMNNEEAEKFITDHLGPFITKTPKSGSVEIVKEK